MVQLAQKDLKVTMIRILKNLEKTQVCWVTENFRREMETVKENQIEILKNMLFKNF